MTTVLESRGVTKTYIGGDGVPLDVLDGVDLRVESRRDARDHW